MMRTATARWSDDLAWLGATLVLGVVGLALFVERPVLGILVLALPAAPLLVLTPSLTMLAVVALVPLDALASIAESKTLTLTRLVGIAVLGGWVVHVLDRRTTLRLGTGGWALLAYVAIAAASLAWSSDVDATVTALKRLAQLFFLYVMVAHLCTERVTLARAADVLLVAGVLLAVMVLLQMPATDTRATVAYGDAVANQNYLAATLVVPAVIAAARGAAGGPGAWWRLAAFVPLAIAIFLTGSRGGGIALAGGLLTLAALRPRFGAGLAVIAFGVLVAGAAIVPAHHAERLWGRWTHAEEDRLSGRLDIWKVGAAMVADQPLLGVGYAGFRQGFWTYMRETEVDPRWALRHFQGNRVAHNVYLGTTAELGLVGVGLLVTALVAHARAVRRAVRRRPDDALAFAMAGVLASILIAGVGIDLLATKVAWLALGLVAGAGRELA